MMLDYLISQIALPEAKFWAVILTLIIGWRNRDWFYEVACEGKYKCNVCNKCKEEYGSKELQRRHTDR